MMHSLYSDKLEQLDSRDLNQKERLLLGKIYEKEKELVLLEDRMFLLRNGN